MADKVDLFNDKGKKIAGDVELSSLAPTRNTSIGKIIHDTKRTAAVNLAGIEKGLATGQFGGRGRHILGRGLNYNLVKNADAIAAEVTKLVQVDAGDDTVVKSLNGGKQLIVQVPTARMTAGAEYVSSLTVAAAATTQAVLDANNVDMFDAPIVKSSIWGSYPQTMNMLGGNVQSILEIPQN
ncbi:MAG: methyl-coenzyme M reductase subunit beta, partial [Methanosarcinales archaeon]|nr:methyl-coenzyme M reductase subunit beta [Methanosarcinales archaeon]